MATLQISYKANKETGKDPFQVSLEKVADAGIANDFLVVRYKDGVVTFIKTEYIDSAQFDPETTDTPQDGEADKSSDDTTA